MRHSWPAMVAWAPVLLAVIPSSGAAAEAVAVAGAATPVIALGDVGIRAADHPGFSRVVFDMPKGASVHAVTEGSRVLLIFSGATRVAQPQALPRNLAGLKVDGPTATLTLVPESRVRQLQIGDRLVIDVVDPSAKTNEPTGKAIRVTPSRPGGPAPAIGPTMPAVLSRQAHLPGAADAAVPTPAVTAPPPNGGGADGRGSIARSAGTGERGHCRNAGPRPWCAGPHGRRLACRCYRRGRGIPAR